MEGSPSESKRAMIYIPLFRPSLPANARRYVLDALDTGWISSLGPYVARFERLFAEFCETRYAIVTCNGTAALHLALATLNIGPGDEVLVPDLTFVATANAVRYTGATPVLVDVDESTWGMDAVDARCVISQRTRAIIPVHLYGRPAYLDSLLFLARDHRIDVIEDAAEAHGARYRGQRVGSIGRLGVFSFYGNKIFTTGEGGAIVTSDPNLAARATFLRDHAMDATRRYYHPETGFNYRMTNIQAAIGCAQLENSEGDAIIARRRTISQAYAAGLAGVPGVSFPSDAPWAESVCWLVSVLIDEQAYGVSRDALIEGLRARGIDSRPFFVPLHELPMYEGASASPALFPVATSLARRGISLPSGTALTGEEIGRVCRAVREIGEQALARERRPGA